ncbi:MAG: relaxase/mobilization nuclease domain-containing protein, partial [Actinobacteria bacterium]|nr:relaxase/mobilization nuclease domain-containing protein [Actinomycetota bacterium]
DHLHNHLIINSVSFVDGRKYTGTRDSLVDLKNESDGLCREYGLSVIEKPFRKVRDSTAEKKLRQRGIRPWKDDLRYFISEAVKNTNNLLELKKYLKFHYGVDIKIQSSNLSFRHPDKQKFCRGKKLGIVWTKDNIEKTFKEKRKVNLKKRKCNPKKEKEYFKNKNRIDILKESINGIEQDISWDTRKEKFKQEKLKELQKEIDTEKYGIDLEDDRGLER